MWMFSSSKFVSITNRIKKFFYCYKNINFLYSLTARFIVLWDLCIIVLKIIFWLVSIHSKQLWLFFQDVFQSCDNSINVGFLLHQYDFTVLIECFIILWLKWAIPNQLHQPNPFSSNDFALLVVIIQTHSFFTFLHNVTLVSFHFWITV